MDASEKKGSLQIPPTSAVMATVITFNFPSCYANISQSLLSVLYHQINISARSSPSPSDNAMPNTAPHTGANGAQPNVRNNGQFAPLATVLKMQSTSELFNSFYVGWNGGIIPESRLSQWVNTATAQNTPTPLSYTYPFLQPNAYNEKYVIEITAPLAKSIKLQDGHSVYVTVETPITNTHIATTLVAKPLNHEDWDMVELNSRYVEEHLLKQIAVVTPNQAVPIWIHSNRPLWLELLPPVDSAASTAPFYCLTNDTELHVEPFVKKKNFKTHADHAISIAAAKNPSFLPLIKSEGTGLENVPPVDSTLSRYRVVPYTSDNSSLLEAEMHTISNCAYMHPSDWYNIKKQTMASIVAKDGMDEGLHAWVSGHMWPLLKENEKQEVDSLGPRALFLLIKAAHIPQGCIAIPKVYRWYYEWPISSCVFVRHLSTYPIMVSKLYVAPIVHDKTKQIVNPTNPRGEGWDCMQSISRLSFSLCSMVNYHFQNRQHQQQLYMHMCSSVMEKINFQDYLESSEGEKCLQYSLIWFLSKSLESAKVLGCWDGAFLTIPLLKECPSELWMAFGGTESGSALRSPFEKRKRLDSVSVSSCRVVEATQSKSHNVFEFEEGLSDFYDSSEASDPVAQEEEEGASEVEAEGVTTVDAPLEPSSVQTHPLAALDPPTRASFWIGSKLLDIGEVDIYASNGDNTASEPYAEVWKSSTDEREPFTLLSDPSKTALLALDPTFVDPAEDTVASASDGSCPFLTTAFPSSPASTVYVHIMMTFSSFTILKDIDALHHISAPAVLPTAHTAMPSFLHSPLVAHYKSLVPLGQTKAKKCISSTSPMYFYANKLFLSNIRNGSIKVVVTSLCVQTQPSHDIERPLLGATHEYTVLTPISLATLYETHKSWWLFGTDKPMVAQRDDAHPNPKKSYREAQKGDTMAGYADTTASTASASIDTSTIADKTVLSFFSASSECVSIIREAPFDLEHRATQQPPTICLSEDTHSALLSNIKQQLLLPTTSTFYGGGESFASPPSIVSGPSGSGKTYVCTSVATELMETHGVFALALNCGNLCSESYKFTSIRQFLSIVFLALSHYAPSLLILDDLDRLCGAVSTENTTSGSLFLERYTHLSEFLSDLLINCLHTMQLRGRIAFVGTVTSFDALNSRLKRSLLFTKEIRIPPPDVSSKIRFVISLIEKLGNNQNYTLHSDIWKMESIRRVISDTENFVISDFQLQCYIYFNALNPLVANIRGLIGPMPSNRADLEFTLRNRLLLAINFIIRTGLIHLWPNLSHDDLLQYVLMEARVDSTFDCDRSSKIVIHMDHFRSALAAYTPRIIQDGSFLKSNVELSEVGGLHKAKEILLDMFKIPLRFRLLSDQMFHSPQKGALLIGPPGCGKTFLVHGIANYFGLRCIGVNGPELLSKYIGMSEESVRRTFERAQRASPCILFFDEIEALAPKRGRDSTGVTDRVVNQLLCYLDGVEERKEVYVLASSSRPDLVDPALLRPGRLDKVCYFGVPKFSEKLHILEICTSGFKNVSKADLHTITELFPLVFTPADIQAVIQRVKMHILQNSAPATEKDDKVEDPAQVDGDTSEITMEKVKNKPLETSVLEHYTVNNLMKWIETAVKEVKSTLSFKELKWYHELYKPFLSPYEIVDIQELEQMCLKQYAASLEKAKTAFVALTNNDLQHKLWIDTAEETEENVHSLISDDSLYASANASSSVRNTQQRQKVALG